MLRKLTLYAFSLSILSFSLFLSSCDDDDDPVAENEAEVITQITLTFNDGTNTVTGTYLDADGDGPGSGVFTPTTIQLDANTTYDLSITFANTLENPVEDKTTEIRDEDHEHQIFFSYTGGVFTNASTNYTDMDENSLPVGLSTNWTTGATASTTGNFTVTLKHQPDGIKTATSTINDGETDIAQTFSIELQ
ncbi:MAG: hypothetical protein ACPGJS_18690 [Flammeovirgaceae bacterium]